MEIIEHAWDDQRSWTRFATVEQRQREVSLRYLPEGGAVLSLTDRPVGWEGRPIWGEGEWRYGDTMRAEQHAADLLVEDRIRTDFDKYIKNRRADRTRYRTQEFAPWHEPGMTGIEY